MREYNVIFSESAEDDLDDIVEFRLADEKDSDRLAALRWQHKAEEKPLDISDRDGFIKICSDNLRIRLKDDLYCWVALENGIIISHIYIVVVKKVPKPDKLDGIWGYTTAVFCVPECRNKGIGSILMKKAKEWCYEKKLELLIVWPSERSVPFYERAGFCGKNDVLELSFE